MYLLKLLSSSGYGWTNFHQMNDKQSSLHVCNKNPMTLNANLLRLWTATSQKVTMVHTSNNINHILLYFKKYK